MNDQYYETIGDGSWSRNRSGLRRLCSISADIVNSILKGLDLSELCHCLDFAIGAHTTQATGVIHFQRELNTKTA